MKKIGIITDIHNNVVALEAMLDVFEKEKCQKIVCCGDILSIGPFPQETVDKIMSMHDITIVRGNHDRYLIEGIPSSENMDSDEIAHHDWEKQMLNEKAKGFISTLPLQIDFEIESVRISLLHYAMDKENRYLSIIRDLDTVGCTHMFQNIDSDVILFGHDHHQNCFQDGNKMYINPGSVGCPSRRLNIAKGGILTIDRGTPSVEFVECSYNVKTVVDAINRINYPCASYIKHGFYGIK